MKKTIRIKQKDIILDIYYCDNCENQVSTLTNTTSTFYSKAFQSGVNKKGEIGTWCSEKCFKEYKKTA